jgi:putative nucleotidyltransferase with HDIG domain
VRRGLTLALLLLGLGALGGLLLGPHRGERLPGPEALRAPAPATIKADRDYELEDAEATSRRRLAAAAAERPVYEEDDSADEEAVARIHAAFALMREEEEAWRGQRPVAPPAELARRYAAERDGFVSRLQVLVRDEDLVALAAARFSEAVERDLAALAAKGLSGLVVGDRALLPADREAGLVVRTFRGGEITGERVLVDLTLVRDLATARDEVVRAGTARLAALPAPLRAALLRLATAAVHPTLVHNQAETERRRAEAAARVRPAVLLVRRGERIVSAGERLEARHLAIFEAMRAQTRGEDRTRIQLGGAVLVLVLVLVLWRFSGGALPRFRARSRDAILLAALLAIAMGLAAAGLELLDLLAEQVPGLPREAIMGLLPLAAGAVVARQVLSTEAALLLSLATGLAAGLVAGPALPLTLPATITSLAVAGLGGPWRQRGGLLGSGIAAGLTGAFLAVGSALLAGRALAEVAVLAGTALAGGLLLVPALAWPLLQAAEGLLGYVTDARLERLANLNHPALKELIVQAPGTYHHSILTGSLAEAAARAIGADPLLARVGAYYHDLGKSRSPLFFAENQRTRNEHEQLAPSVSATVLVRHVADGLELARRYRLPRPVVDIVAQHHGTRLVGYFWAKQQKLSEAGATPGPEVEALFRYPGPRPQGREAALVMLADACEASARALEAPTPAQLRAIVDKRIAEVVAERQLDESELTLGDLEAVSRAMAEALAAVHRGRPAAPTAEPGAPVIHLVARP